MNIVAQTLMDAAEPLRKEKPEKIPTVRIKSQFSGPSLTLISVIAISFVVIFCFLSIIQIVNINNSVSELREQVKVSQQTLYDLEKEIVYQQYLQNSSTEVIPSE
ncbi:MAG: hypothetical protein MJ236_06100 [Clostridia bacterium]|nr:hypothetical protein [Clostridia bacterium]